MGASDPAFQAVRPTVSELPEVRVINAWQSFALHLVGSLGELTLIVAATFLLYHGKLSQELWAAACVVPVIGAGVGKARGKVAGSTMVTLAGAAATALRGAHHLLLPLAFAVGTLGCGTTLPAKPIADARELIDSTDPYVAELDRGLLAIEPVLLAACTGSEPLLPADKCAPALKGYDAAAVALDKAQEVLVAVDAALAVLEAVAQAAQ